MEFAPAPFQPCLIAYGLAAPVAASIMTRKRSGSVNGGTETKRTRSNLGDASTDMKQEDDDGLVVAINARPDALEALELQQAADASKAAAAETLADAAPERGPSTPVANEGVPVRRSAAHARARRCD